MNDIELNMPESVPAYMTNAAGDRVRVGTCFFTDDGGEDISVKVEFDPKYNQMFGKEDSVSISLQLHDNGQIAEVDLFEEELSMMMDVSPADTDDDAVEGEIIE